VSVIIIAHNEQDVIEDRIRNCLSTDYPNEKLEIIVASDASTDDTVERARSVSPVVQAFDNTPQNKSETRNMAVERASSEIVLFTDADTKYDSECIHTLVNRLSESSVGMACGTLVTESFSDGPIGAGMGIYWKWEYYMRRLQSRLGLLVKSSGGNMGMRKEYFEPVPDVADIDQVAGFMTIRNGGRSVYVPEAVATEEFPTSVRGEFETRRRLTIRALTALWINRDMLYFPSRPFLAVHTMSYWLLRYLVPTLLVGTFVAPGILAFSDSLFVIVVLLQATFYGLAVAGFAAEKYEINSPVFGIPFSYCWANAGVFVGLVAFLRGTRIYAYDADK